MNRKVVIAVVLVLLGVGYYIYSRPKPVEYDFTEHINNRIADSNKRYQRYDAVEFFEAGGHYAEMGDDPEESPFDKPYVLPLIQQLETEFGLDFYILASPQKDRRDPLIALELVAEIPPGTSTVALKEFLKSYDESTPGKVLQEWGTDVLSLDFLNVEEAEAMQLQ